MARFSAPRVVPVANAGTTMLVLLASAVIYSAPLRAHVNLLGFAQDDFYYYLIAARNLGRGLGTTFDGTTLTNGYHPLYLLLIYVVGIFAKSLRAVFWFLAAFDIITAVSIFLAARAFLRRIVNSVWLQNALALVILDLCHSVICEQMEVNLALPLGMLFLLLFSQEPATISVRRWVAIGLVGSLLILARLDAVLLVGLCGVLALIVPQYRASLTLPKVTAFLCGLMPLVLTYLAINRVVFHRFTPISGAAKQLAKNHVFAWHALRVSLSPQIRFMFFAEALSLALIPFLWKRLTTAERVVWPAALLFPFVHWSLNLWLSDWLLWPWYSYSVRMSMLAAAAMLASIFSRWLQPAAPLLLAGAALLFVSRHYLEESTMKDVANGAVAISQFTETHPGRYAMGDRAGMPVYLSTQPFIQTEGLMMDDAFLAHVRRQDPLKDVLKLYKVDYYVAFESTMGNGGRMLADGCFHAKEPAQAGDRSPVMRDVFCQRPVMEYFGASTGPTRIFDLHQPQSR